jgi:predicted acyl esterase
MTITPLTVTLACLLLAAAPTAVAAAGTGKYAVTFKSMSIPTAPGVNLTATVWLPTPAAPGERFPLLVFANSWSMPVEEYIVKSRTLAERGYVALEYETRGWWSSTGTIDDCGPGDMADHAAVLDYALAQPAWRANRSSVAAVGISYGAGIALLAGALDARVTAVVAMSGWNNMTDLMVGNDTPNWVENQGLMADAKKYGRPGAALQRMMTAAQRHAGLGFLYNYTLPRSPQRYLAEYKRRQLPIFLSSNYLDRYFRPQYMVEFFGLLEAPKMLLLNQGPHAIPEAIGVFGIGASHIWGQASEWLAHYLKGVDNGIERGPAVQLQHGASMNSKVYLPFAALPDPARMREETLYLSSRASVHGYGGLVRAAADIVPASAATADRVTFSKAPGLTSGYQHDLRTALGVPFDTALGLVPGEHALIYKTAPLANTTRICGEPTFDLRFAANSGSWQVFGFVYDVGVLQHGALLKES